MSGVAVQLVKKFIGNIEGEKMPKKGEITEGASNG